MDKYDRGNAYDETFLPITTMYYLYLSGTPFRALNSGEFIEDQIYNWNTRMNSGQRKTGRVTEILMPHFPVW